jgi:purine-binding chemotaxis protein CheW
MNEQNEKSTSNRNKSIDDILQLVTFHIGDEEFAVDILNIQGINRMVEVTETPNAPDFVEGIINLRGKVIPLINLRKRLGLPSIAWDKSSRFIVVELGDKVLGFIVDSVNEVLRINSNATEPPPSMVAGIRSDFITSVAKYDNRLLILLDLNKILSKDEKDIIQNSINL